MSAKGKAWVAPRRGGYSAAGETKVSGSRGSLPPGNTETWQVHVSGPDDILPATDRLDAITQAQQINATSITAIVMSNDDPLMPLAWAVPQRSDAGPMTSSGGVA